MGRRGNGITLEMRFAENFIRRGEDECWPWTGYALKGYGKMFLSHGRYGTATHVALELAGRPRPSPEHCALHTCDNPPCVNPKHLWWGTRTENAHDMCAKGRKGVSRLFGCDNPASKLTDDMIYQIIESPDSNVKIAERFGISRQYIWELRHGKRKTRKNMTNALRADGSRVVRPFRGLRKIEETET